MRIPISGNQTIDRQTVRLAVYVHQTLPKLRDWLTVAVEVGRQAWRRLRQAVRSALARGPKSTKGTRAVFEAPGGSSLESRPAPIAPIPKSERF